MRLQSGTYGLAALALLTCGSMLPQAKPAFAQNYGCACLHNRTNVAINFRYKWGDGEWKKVHLPVNYNDALCWRYSEGRRSSPQLTFELDVDMTDGKAWAPYAVSRVQSPGNTCSQIPANGHYDINYRSGSNRTLIAIFKR